MSKKWNTIFVNNFVDNINKVIEGQPPSPMNLDLYHVRSTPNQDMDSCGTQGPLIYVDCVVVTYANSIRLRFTGQFVI